MGLQMTMAAGQSQDQAKTLWKQTSPLATDSLEAVRDMCERPGPLVWKKKKEQVFKVYGYEYFAPSMLTVLESRLAWYLQGK